MAYLFLVLAYAFGTQLRSLFNEFLSGYYFNIQCLHQREREREIETEKEGLLWGVKKIDLTAIFHATLFHVCVHTWIHALTASHNTQYIQIKYISMCVCSFPQGGTELPAESGWLYLRSHWPVMGLNSSTDLHLVSLVTDCLEPSACFLTAAKRGKQHKKNPKRRWRAYFLKVCCFFLYSLLWLHTRKTWQAE